MPEMKIDPKEKTLQLLCQLLEKIQSAGSY